MSATKLNLEELKDWADFDVTLFQVGRALGIFSKEYSNIPNIRSLLWSKNSVNDCLSKIVRELVQIGYLECDEDQSRFRLKKGFDLNKL